MCLQDHRHQRRLPYYIGSLVCQNSDLLHPTNDPMALQLAPRFAIFVNSADPDTSNGCPGDIHIIEQSPTQYSVFVKTDSGWVQWTNLNGNQAVEYPNLRPTCRLFCPTPDGAFYHGRTTWVRLKKNLGETQISAALRTTVHLLRANPPREPTTETPSPVTHSVPVSDRYTAVLQPIVERVFQDMLQRSLSNVQQRDGGVQLPCNITSRSLRCAMR